MGGTGGDGEMGKWEGRVEMDRWGNGMGWVEMKGEEEEEMEKGQVQVQR